LRRQLTVQSIEPRKGEKDKFLKLSTCAEASRREGTNLELEHACMREFRKQ